MKSVRPRPIFCTIAFFFDGLPSFFPVELLAVAVPLVELVELVPLVDDGVVVVGRRRDLRGGGLEVVVLFAGFSTVFGREVKNAPRVFS